MSAQCYNKGCGGKFDPNSNTDESCTFHPGPPFFHDAYKGWSCCGKKCTDFTEFLNTKGCKKGPHNPEKPPEVEKPKPSPLLNGDSNGVNIQEAPKPPKPREPASRDAAKDEKVELRKIISSTAEANFKACMEEKEKQVKGPEMADSTSVNILPGTSCKNSGCTLEYLDKSSDMDPCFFHSGEPVFHEGMKFWSCCQRKTSDFNNFLNQMGCEKGKHQWIKESDGKEETKMECRRDFHQTGSDVIVTVYCKNSHPHDSHVTVNTVSLVIHILDIQGKIYHADIPLWGAINPEISSVTFTPSKVEMKLKKAEPMSWVKLEYEKPKPKKK